MIFEGRNRAATPHLVNLINGFIDPAAYRLIDETEVDLIQNPVLAPLSLPGPPGWWLGKRSANIFDETIFEKLDETQLRMLRHDRVVPAFDNLGEGRALSGWWLEPFLEKMSAYGIPAGRTLWLTQNLESRKNIEEWEQTHPERRSMTPFSLHSSMGLTVISARRRFGENLEGLADLHEHAKMTSAGRNRRPDTFLCLNRRLKPHRLALGLHIIRQKHHERGKLSLIETGDITDASNLLRKVMSRGEAEALSRFWMDNPSTLPKFLDVDSESAFKSSRAIGPVKPFFADTYFSIVTESNFVGDSVFRFTEKTWKPIIMFHPFLMLGPAGLMKELRRLGFQTFHPLIDESYDDETDHRVRFKLVLKEVDRLGALSNGALQQLYSALWPAIEHNHHYIFDLAPRYFSERIDALRVKINAMA